MFGRRRRIVIIILALLAACIALAAGYSLLFRAPPPSAGVITPVPEEARDAPGTAGAEHPRAALPRLEVAPDVALETPSLPSSPLAPPPIVERLPDSGQMPDAGPASQPTPQVAVLPAEPRPGAVTPAQPAWKRNAAHVVLDPGKPMVAIVIDDLGMDRPGTRRAMRLPPPVTLAFLPYAEGVGELAAVAHRAGHELLVHVSMEPEGHGDSGPNTLMVGRPPEEIRARLDWALSQLDGYVGINNHMGSRFTADAAGMDVVLAELHARGLLFLDSRTAPETIGFKHARMFGVPAASRNVFLDDTRTREAVDHQLRVLEQRARAKGKAVAIGHPHDVTLAALEAWLPTLAAKGLQLAPVSAVVESSLIQATTLP